MKIKDMINKKKNNQEDFYFECEADTIKVTTRTLFFVIVLNKLCNLQCIVLIVKMIS